RRYEPTATLPSLAVQCRAAARPSNPAVARPSSPVLFSQASRRTTPFGQTWVRGSVTGGTGPRLTIPARRACRGRRAWQRVARGGRNVQPRGGRENAACAVGRGRPAPLRARFRDRGRALEPGHRPGAPLRRGTRRRWPPRDPLSGQGPGARAHAGGTPGRWITTGRGGAAVRGVCGRLARGPAARRG